MTADQKQNYCDKHGVCNAPKFQDERGCEFYQPSMIMRIEGGCILRTWYQACLSTKANEAANHMERTPPEVDL
jgi:hypothetical protein